MGMIEQSIQRQLVRRRVSIHPHAQTAIDHLRRSNGRFQLLVGSSGERLGQPDEDFPIVQRAFRFGEDCAVEAADVTHRKHIERRVVMIVFQRRGGRQDQVGITRGFIDVQIDTDHELQTIERLFEFSTVGRGQHRVARHGDQCADLPFPFGKHFLGQRRHRQFTRIFRATGHPALPQIEMPARCRGHQVHRRLGAQRTANAVEVAGDQVDQLHQPMAQRTESLGRDPHAAVTNRARRCGEVSRQLADLHGRHGAQWAHGFSGEGGDSRTYFIQTVHR
ncbi:hypothetical protein D3C80_1241410 [compost metagenome]